jgi:hypothetical protein
MLFHAATGTDILMPDDPAQDDSGTFEAWMSSPAFRFRGRRQLLPLF